MNAHTRWFLTRSRTARHWRDYLTAVAVALMLFAFIAQGMGVGL